jgi:hypothetical protein
MELWLMNGCEADTADLIPAKLAIWGRGTDTRALILPGSP